MAYEFDLPLNDSPHDEAAARLASEVTELGNERFLRAVVRAEHRLHHRSVDTLIGLPSDLPDVAEPDSSLLLRALHLCFTAHLPLSLSPDVLWYAVVHEVATHVRLNADTYASLFTDTPGYAQTIVVRDDDPQADWGRAIRRFQGPLRERIGGEAAELFQPAFSTTTEADATATLVALMDVVSPYYRFRLLTLCGIPRIRLEGTDRDWRLLLARARELAGWFDGLKAWFDGLLPVLEKIADTASGWGVDEEFWRSVYKWDSASGGAHVTGWINAFFAHEYTDDGPVPKQSFGTGSAPDGRFPAHVSKVPFDWQTPAGTFGMAFLGGALGIERDGEWVRPRLGHAVVELLPAAPRDPRLPEPWTIDDIRRRTGCADAELTETVGDVSTVDGESLRPTCVINVKGFCAVLSDGVWYLGGLVSDAGDIRCWETCGPDLGTALMFL